MASDRPPWAAGECYMIKAESCFETTCNSFIREFYPEKSIEPANYLYRYDTIHVDQRYSLVKMFDIFKTKVSNNDSKCQMCFIKADIFTHALDIH